MSPQVCTHHATLHTYHLYCVAAQYFMTLILFKSVAGSDMGVMVSMTEGSKEGGGTGDSDGWWEEGRRAEGNDWKEWKDGKGGVVTTYWSHDTEGRSVPRGSIRRQEW